MRRVAFGVLLITVLALFALPSATMKQVSAADVLPKVQFELEKYIGAVGNNISVSVMISNATDLFVYQAFADFNSDILNVESITQGSFLNRGGEYTTFFLTDSDTPGLIKVGCGLLHGSPPASGDGELFKVTFGIKGAGSTALHLHDVILLDKFGTVMSFTTEDSVFMGGLAGTVGGYSLQTRVPTETGPLLTYIALVGALTVVFMKLKPKTKRER
jgi:hypothetical protein